MTRRQLDRVRRDLAGRALGLAAVLARGGAACVSLWLAAGGDPADPASWIVARRIGGLDRGLGAELYPWVDDPPRVAQARVEHVLLRRLGIGVAA